MNQSINQIKDSLQAGQPIVQIVSSEEKRVESFLKKLCQQILKNQNIIWLIKLDYFIINPNFFVKIAMFFFYFGIP